MSKTVNLSLSEKQFNQLKLCFNIGDMIKDSIETKSSRWRGFVIRATPDSADL